MKPSCLTMKVPDNGVGWLAADAHHWLPAGMLTAEELQQECVLPKVARLPLVTQAVAEAVAAAAAAGGPNKIV